ncbi:GNAT family N-acetyltransferase [Granulosicoccus sp.]|nr:GNAT family N-acetyltransferase [Granulosicoccus sp.]
MQVEEIKEFNPDVLEALKILLPQLSNNAALPTMDLTRKIVESDVTRLLFARQEERTLGMLTIVIFPIATGVRAWIEDVVVDESGRGMGVGEALSKHALKLARSEGAKNVDLTSRPSREAANRLYQRIGFVLRETNVYRFEIDD